MPDTVKVSVSLPRRLLDAAEQRRAATGESRSEFFRRAVSTLLREERRARAVRRYVDGYVAEPETTYDTEAADAAAAEALAGEPWE